MNRTERAALKRVRVMLDAAPTGAWFATHHGKLVRVWPSDLRTLVSLAEQADEMRRQLDSDWPLFPNPGPNGVTMEWVRRRGWVRCETLTPRRGKARRR